MKEISKVESLSNKKQEVPPLIQKDSPELMKKIDDLAEV